MIYYQLCITHLERNKAQLQMQWEQQITDYDFFISLVMSCDMKLNFNDGITMHAFNLRRVTIF